MADAGAKYNRYPGSCADSGLPLGREPPVPRTIIATLGLHAGAHAVLAPFGARYAIGEPGILRRGS